MDARILTDEQLYESACGGDAEAFGVLYVRYFDKVTSKCRAWAGFGVDAEDLAQDVFAEALVRVRAGTDRPRGEFGAWLVGTVTAYVLTCYRRAWWVQARAVAGAKAAAEQEWREHASVTPAKRAVEREVTGVLAQGLASLTPKRRLSLQMCVLDGMPKRRVAEQIGSTEDAVRMLVRNGLADLRARVAVAA